MSVSCSCLVLFLLCLSLHACHARRDLRSVDRYKKSQQTSQIYFNKGQEEISIPMKKPGDQSNIPVKTTIDKLNKAKTEDGKEKGFFDNDAKSHETKNVKDSVSWHVPHKKRKEKQPGFNLDYSPPKTHPPSHN